MQRSGGKQQRRLLAALLALAAACRGEAEPSWIVLGREPEAFVAAESVRELALDEVRSLRRVTTAQETWLELSFEHGAWSPLPSTRIWLATLGLPLVQQGRLTPETCELRAGERTFRLKGADEAGVPPPGTFHLRRGKLALSLPAGEEPPDEVVLAVRSRGGGERLRGVRFSGEGILVSPGERLERVVDVPPASALRFATTLDPVLERAGSGLTFRALLDGEPIFEHRVADASVELGAWHTVELPREGRSGARLALEVEGDFGHTSFLAPVIGPAEPGRPGARPWGRTRPDVVLFLADTFRADSMAVYGGTGGLTPNLDRLVERSLCFRHAWSVGTFTLPAHASMFSGLFPPQARALSLGRALPEELLTLAELMARNGYRTGAVTDSGIVSSSFGMDQGFASFDEDRALPATTLERARSFLDADDGRPTFLFVQTYRTHTPYLVSEETRREYGEQLGLEGDYETLQEELMALADEHGFKRVNRFSPPRALTSLPAAAGIVRALEAHYRGGVVDLDRDFGVFVAELENRGLLDSGYLVFTSDHGEAFGEHGSLYHGQAPYEELARIPLLLTGGDLEPAVVDHPASLIDVPTTIASLAGVAPPASWLGTSLPSLDRSRPIFSFGTESDDSCFSVVEELRKVLGREVSGRVAAGSLEAYDLARDPREERDVADEAGWPREMLERHGSLVEHLLVPLVGPRAAELDADKLEELRELGYADG